MFLPENCCSCYIDVSIPSELCETRIEMCVHVGQFITFRFLSKSAEPISKIAKFAIAKFLNPF